VFIRGRVFLCAQEKGRPENAALVRSREDVPVELERTVFIPANQKKTSAGRTKSPRILNLAISAILAQF
jgi:hypothetical protein